MKSKIWQGLVAVAGASLLAVTMGSAVVAMINDDPEPAASVTRDDAQGGSAISAICAVGVTDCNDMIVDGEGDFAQCAADVACDGYADCAPEGCSAYKCAADTDCIEPGQYALESFSCEPGLTYEACLPDGAPADYDCATQESEPIVVVCKSLNCGYYDGNGVDSPLPAEDLAGTIETLPPPDDGTLVDPALGDPRIAIGEPRPVCALPPLECEGGPAVDCDPVDCSGGSAVDCGSVDPCTLSSPPELREGYDPSTGVVEPDCQPIDPCAISSVPRCLPPDCSVSSDGAIACPDSPPCVGSDDAATEPDCIAIEPPIEGAVGGTSPGSPGAGGTD